MRHNNKRLIIIIILIVFIGLSTLTYLNHSENKRIIKENVLNVTELISTNIYSEIQLELIKPIYVSLTMANDSFVKKWMLSDAEENEEVIVSYLSEIRKKYNYDSSFLVSNITKNYYHHSGILKKVSRNDSHDVWFYNAIEKNLLYDLDVDTDQASQDDLTLFINCVIHDEDESPLGITGVGVKMKHIIEIIDKYNKTLGVETYLISSNGLIQIHAIEDFIEERNIFNIPLYSTFSNEILLKGDTPTIIEIEESERFLISYYIEELNWHLIVEKDTDLLYDSLEQQLIRQLGFFLFAFLILSSVSVRVINHYQKINLDLASKDSMTGTMNRQAFDEHLDNLIQKLRIQLQPMSVLILDIDNFKNINDSYGHLEGDRCICAVADLIDQFIYEDEMLARWGGDEFAIIFNRNIDETLQLIEEIMKAKDENPVFERYGITLSFGVTTYRKGDTINTLVGRADKALYLAKENGKNRVATQ